MDLAWFMFGLSWPQFGAYLERDNPLERSEVNVALLRNLLDATERIAPGLRHVTLYQGGKAYGADLGPFGKTIRV